MAEPDEDFTTPQATGIVASIVAIGAIIPFVLIWGFQHGWGQGQWGPVAAWLSSLLTVGAVGVALYQAVMARRDAEQARADAAKQVAQARDDAEAERERAAEERAIAEERHAQRLEQSEKLLTRQLDAQQRAKQIESILPIWPALAEVRAWYKYHYKPEISAISSERSNGDITRKEARARLTQLRTEWDSVEIKTDLIFEPPIQLVVQENVGPTLINLYYRFMEFGTEIRKVVSAMEAGAKVTFKPTDPFMSTIREYRTAMLNLVRIYLTQAPPINFDRVKNLGQTETVPDTDESHETDDPSR